MEGFYANTAAESNKERMKESSNEKEKAKKKDNDNSEGNIVERPLKGTATDPVLAPTERWEDDVTEVEEEINGETGNNKKKEDEDEDDTKDDDKDVSSNITTRNEVTAPSEQGDSMKQN